MKLLITGGSGFLGIRAAEYLSTRHTVSAPSHRQLDITDEAALHEALQRLRPDAVIHCAAISDTGLSARRPDLSEAVNLRATEALARACARHDCRLLYMSSDQVYDGLTCAGPLREHQAEAPANVYGRHKLEAERAVRALLPSAVGLRLTWMFDRPDAPWQPNRGLLVNLSRAAAEGSTVTAATHEHRGMTNVWDVVHRLEAALALPGGVYNFGSENTLDTYSVFLLAARRLCPPPRIEADEARFADRPRNLAIDTALLRSHGITFPTTQEALAQLP